MNLDVKIFNKILANRIKEHIENIIYHDQLVFIPDMQRWLVQHMKIRKYNQPYKQIERKKEPQDHLIRCRKGL